MAEAPEIPEIKIQKEYHDPPNVEAAVPETQKIREYDGKNNSSENIMNVEFEYSPVVTVNGSEITISGADEVKNNRTEDAEEHNQTSSEKAASPGAENNTSEIKITGADFSYSPVITVTKKESAFTKGDIKLQKVTVTEDIAVSYRHLFKKDVTPGKTVVTSVQKLEYKY